MRTFGFTKRARGLVLAVAATVALSGCVKTDQIFTLYPDGSGKVELKAILQGQIAMVFQMLMQQQGTDNIETIVKQSFRLDGIAGWKDLKAEPNDDGTFTVTGTAYFEDINKVKSEGTRLEFKRIGGAPADGGGDTQPREGAEGYEVTVGQRSLDRMPQEMPPEQREQILGMARGMLAGFETKTVVVMPGLVKEAEHCKVDGRKATHTLVEEDVIRAIEEGKRPAPTRVVSGPAVPEVAAEHEAFKKELAEVKAAAAAQGKGGPEPKKSGPEKKPEPKKGGPEPL